jgi:hypothetical protein
MGRQEMSKTSLGDPLAGRFGSLDTTLKLLHPGTLAAVACGAAAIADGERAVAPDSSAPAKERRSDREEGKLMRRLCELGDLLGDCGCRLVLVSCPVRL